MKKHYGWLLALWAGLGLLGCGPKNEAQVSPEYAKLPPGVGQQRLKETLMKRNGGKMPANAVVPGGATGGQ